MPKYKLTGDICHPGVILVDLPDREVQAILGEEMIAIADFDEEQLQIYDEDTSPKVAAFIPDGTIRDKDDNDVELPRRVEMLLVHEAGDWTTEVFDIPATACETSQDSIEDWWRKEHGCKDMYRKVLAAKVWDVDPDEGNS